MVIKSHSFFIFLFGHHFNLVWKGFAEIEIRLQCQNAPSNSSLSTLVLRKHHKAGLRKNPPNLICRLPPETEPPAFLPFRQEARKNCANTPAQVVRCCLCSFNLDVHFIKRIHPYRKHDFQITY